MSKMDGLVNLENVLVVGMTNRKELLDEALLRPGRMEVRIRLNLSHYLSSGRRDRSNKARKTPDLVLRYAGGCAKLIPVFLDFTLPQPPQPSHFLPRARLLRQVCMPIPLPDASGREQILAIHLRRAREAGLVCEEVDDASLAARTDGFSGADLAGLVRSATSFALADWRRKRGDTGDAGADGGSSRGGRRDGDSAGKESGSRGEGGDGGPAVEITSENMEQALREVTASGGGRRNRGLLRGLGGVGGVVRGSLGRVLSTPRGGEG